MPGTQTAIATWWHNSSSNGCICRLLGFRGLEGNTWTFGFPNQEAQMRYSLCSAWPLGPLCLLSLYIYICLVLFDKKLWCVALLDAFTSRAVGVNPPNPSVPLQQSFNKNKFASRQTPKHSQNQHEEYTLFRTQTVMATSRCNWPLNLSESAGLQRFTG